MQKSFTLIETIIAISLLVVGVLVIYGSSARIIYQVGENTIHFTASYLAQEGVEVVRNIRDGNWIEANASGQTISWDDELADGTYYVQYNSAELIPETVDNIPNMEVNDSSHYGYQALGLGGTGIETTNFKRVITLDHIEADVIQVKSEISWRDGSITAEEFLYNWNK